MTDEKEIDLEDYDLSGIFITFKDGTTRSERERGLKDLIRKGHIHPPKRKYSKEVSEQVVTRVIRGCEKHHHPPRELNK